MSKVRDWYMICNVCIYVYKICEIRDDGVLVVE